MRSISSQASDARITAVLASVREKGVKLWSVNGRLYYRAPKGVLTPEEVESLRLSRNQLVAILERSTGAPVPEPSVRSRRDRALLTFTQLAHWRMHRLSERPAIRQIASATRLRGRLNLDALGESITEVVNRHDALRTRILVSNGVPMQEVSESSDVVLDVDDLRELSESLREMELMRLIDQLIMEPIKVAEGPLCGMRLARLRDDEHVLIVAMEHMISDDVSMRILLREIMTGYVQRLKGCAISLPEIPVQFSDYAVWQRGAERGMYSGGRLAGCQRVRFPESASLGERNQLGWGIVPLKIGRDVKEELREWSRQRQTTMVMSVLSAYVAVVLRWCNVSDMVFQYQSDGRFSPRTENTIGYFAAPLYLRIWLLENDNFIDLLNRVTKEYCRAYECDDFSCITSQEYRREFTRNTAFNWIPQDSGLHLADLDGSEGEITCSPVRFYHPMRRNLEMDNEPTILLYDVGDEITGYLNFPRNRFSEETMERFGCNFFEFIMALLKAPEGRINDIPLV